MAIHLLGIRHHGPGSCRNVLEYLQELQPDLILLEGPAEAETLLPCVLNEQMEPPVALLAYQPDQPQNAVFYPFAEFSPEWQTIAIVAYIAFCGCPAERSTVTFLRFTTGTFDGAKSGAP